MAITQLRASSQVMDLTLTRGKLKSDFLEGADLNVTNGANNATLTGLKDGVNPQDAVTVAQLTALAQSLSAGLIYRGALAAGANLSANSTGNAYLDSTAGLKTGDFFIITGNGTITDGTNTRVVNAGDMLVANKNKAADATINVAQDFDIVDNTEADDILRTTDVVNNLASTATNVPLSAAQGKVLNDRLVAVEAFGIPVYSETLAVSNGSAIVGDLINMPVPGSVQVFLNGMRMAPGAGNDYTISGKTITFQYPLTTGDSVLVDYHR